MVSSQIPTPETRQPSKHYSSWHRLRWGVLVLMLMLGPGRIGVQFLISSRTAFSTQPLTQSVERKTLPVTITANGTVYAARSINLSPKSAGVIEQLLVQEGDRVRQGQLVANMDDSNLRGQLTQMQGQLAQQEANLQRLLAGNRREDIAKAKAQLTEARAQLQQLQTGSRPQEVAQAEARLQQAQATLKLRETDWQRYQQLYQAGAVSRESRDQKRTDRDVTKNQVREAEQALALQQAGPRAEELTQAAARVTQQEQTLAVLQAGNRTEDIAQARAQVLSAQGSLATIQSQLWDAKILAPFDGVVTQIYADVGAFVSPSMAGSGISASSSSILTLVSDRYEVVVNLSEAQIAQVKLEQKVNVKIDALPKMPLTGTVSQIAPQATVTQNVTSFEVRVTLPPTTTEKLKVGMNVEAAFEVDRLENALLVPNAAVVRQANQEGVYILAENRQPKFQVIQTGVTANGQTEVTSGLKGHEHVLISPPTESKSEPNQRFPFGPRPQE